MTDETLRCLIADDHPALLAAVSRYLAESGFEIVVAEHGQRAVKVAEETQPDVALVDYRMPRLAGPDLVRRLVAAAPAMRVAVYTADADDRLVATALEAGAAAVVLKEAPLADVVRALDAVLAGGMYVDPVLAPLVVARDAKTSLTDRERDVLSLLAEGLSHEEIGGRLSISAETVRTHVRKACERLGAVTRTQAVAIAVRRRLID